MNKNEPRPLGEVINDLIQSGELPKFKSSKRCKGMDKMSKIKKEELVREILANFDFAKVHRIMLLLNWQWRGKTPTIGDLSAEAGRLLRNVIYNDNVYSSGTGGLQAFKTDESLELYFILEQSFALIKK